DRNVTGVQTCALPILGNPLLHGVQGFGYLDGLAVFLHFSCNHPVRAEDRPDALAAAGAQQSGEAVYLTLLYVEVKGLDTRVALEIGRASCRERWWSGG